MKTITVSLNAVEVNALLEQAREEDILVRAADGTEFMVSAVDDFEDEVARTRRNARLMAMLDERATQEQTISLDEVKRRLGVSG
jgi:hypothetical protein